ncbi:hypothetical protein BDR04DRAFT_886164 [Suillus decipiens]|nr:hypothetical protein BDR04DRAFT_886164 [Suillus decipiens]
MDLVGGNRCLLCYTFCDCPSFQYMPRSTRCEQVEVISTHVISRSHLKCCRSVFIKSLLILCAFELSLDHTKPQGDMGFMTGTLPNVPCAIKFRTKAPEAGFRCLMQNYPEAA